MEQVSLRGASAKEISREALLEKVSQERELRSYLRHSSAAALFIQVRLFFLNVDMSIYIYEEDRLAVARARKIELVHLESFLGVIRLMVFGMILILSGSISLLVSLLFLRRFSKFHHICFVFLWNFYFF